MGHEVAADHIVVVAQATGPHLVGQQQQSRILDAAGENECLRGEPAAPAIQVTRQQGADLNGILIGLDSTTLA